MGKLGREKADLLIRPERIYTPYGVGHGIRVPLRSIRGQDFVMKTGFI